MILLHVITYMATEIKSEKTGIKIILAVSHMGNKTLLEKPRIWCITVNTGESESWSFSCYHR